MPECILGIAGDLFLANLHFNIGSGVGSRLLSGGSDNIGLAVSSFTQGTDCFLANLESPLAFIDRRGVDQHCFGGAIDFARYIPEWGIDVVNIANNHLMDHGENGFHNTIKALNNFSIPYIGIEANGLSNEFIKDINGIRVGMCGFSLVPDNATKRLYAFGDPETMIMQVRELKKRSDHVVISIHWGDEYVHLPSIEQIELAHALIENGASIIVGHHPHVFQGVEDYNGGLIFYSLGNFVFDMLWSSDTRWGVVGNITLSQNEVVLTGIHDFWINRYYSPIIPSSRQKKWILKQKKITANMMALYKEDKATYYKIYLKMKKKHLFTQRLLMRLFVLKNLNHLSLATVKFLFNKQISRVRL